MRKPLRIGLTGGIASGKSTVADMFAARGITVIDTDRIARELVQPGQPALHAVQAEFGKEILDARGRLDRAAMRRLVFSDADARQRLEKILHPLIQQETLRRISEADGDYIVVVVPLLTGSSLRDHLDRILVVDCDEVTQLARLQQRDAESADQARRILAAQATREQRLAIADDVIHNDSSIESLAAQLSALHDTYLALAHLPAR